MRERVVSGWSAKITAVLSLTRRKGRSLSALTLEARIIRRNPVNAIQLPAFTRKAPHVSSGHEVLLLRIVLPVAIPGTRRQPYSRTDCS